MAEMGGIAAYGVPGASGSQQPVAAGAPAHQQLLAYLSGSV